MDVRIIHIMDDDTLSYLSDNETGDFVKLRDFVRWMPCPGCQQPIRYYNNGFIEVNVESLQDVKINGLWCPDVGCENPFCKWSKIE